MKAILVIRRKSVDSEGNRIEAVIWRIPAGEMRGESVRYRMAFLPKGFAKPVVLYDNHHPKGHHKHLEDVENGYEFSDVSALIRDFDRDVERWKESRK